MFKKVWVVVFFAVIFMLPAVSFAGVDNSILAVNSGSVSNNENVSGSTAGTTSGSSTSGAGTTSEQSNKPVKFENPIEYDNVSGVVGAVLKNLRGILVSIALVFIVIGAIMYILSAGDETKMKSAKSAITAALIGLAIALAAPTFLSEIIKILGGTSPDSGITDPGGISLKTIITNVLDFLLGIVGILSMIGLVVGGSFYLTAYGDDKRAEDGKKIITASIIGIVVALGALALVTQVAKFFQ